MTHPHPAASPIGVAGPIFVLPFPTPSLAANRWPRPQHLVLTGIHDLFLGSVNVRRSDPDVTAIPQLAVTRSRSDHAASRLRPRIQRQLQYAVAFSELCLGGVAVLRRTAGTSRVFDPVSILRVAFVIDILRIAFLSTVRPGLERALRLAILDALRVHLAFRHLLGISWRLVASVSVFVYCEGDVRRIPM
ncbi:hypothetical protein C8R44DRAFT_879671 [Mycena epipterygia]|nr:hypothetical protein C8R44DRAFT_879671 [Mycena epipterygia]